MVLWEINQNDICKVLVKAIIYIHIIKLQNAKQPQHFWAINFTIFSTSIPASEQWRGWWLYSLSLSLSLYKCYFWLLIVKKTFFWHKHVYRNVRVALRHLAHLMLTLARSVDQLRSRDHVRFGRPISEGNLEKWKDEWHDTSTRYTAPEKPQNIV